jgi:hypothetical protein
MHPTPLKIKISMDLHAGEERRLSLSRIEPKLGCSRLVAAIHSVWFQQYNERADGGNKERDELLCFCYRFLRLRFGQWHDLQLFSEVAPLAAERR